MEPWTMTEAKFERALAEARAGMVSTCNGATDAVDDALMLVASASSPAEQDRFALQARETWRESVSNRKW